MKLVLCWFCCWFLLLVPAYSKTTVKKIDHSLLYRTLDALTRGLHYMDKAVDEVNFDAVFMVHRVEEQLQSFLQFQPDVFKPIHTWVEGLRRRAQRTVVKGRKILIDNEHPYTKTLLFVLLPSKKMIWYPSLSTSPNAIVVPGSCVDAGFHGDFSNWCYSHIEGNSSSACQIPDICMEHYQNMTQKNYGITHQVLFWELMELRNCINKMSKQLRTDFCSNVMRDAKIIEERNFPNASRDLFMEQIGLCGIWGFKDFHRREWLEQILQWQRPSGCYDQPWKYQCEDDLNVENHTRNKRDEQLLSDGCLAHKTGVALMAYVSSLRFEAEKIYAERKALEKGNSVGLGIN